MQLRISGTRKICNKVLNLVEEVIKGLPLRKWVEIWRPRGIHLEMWGDQGSVADGGEGDTAGLSGFEKSFLGFSEGTENPVVWVEDKEEE